MNNNQSYITKQGLQKLKQELVELKEARRDIASRIQDAKELGDLSENAEYQEAKNAQAFNEGRILDVENVLKNAEVIKETRQNNTVQVGSSIKVKSDGEEADYKIVGSNEADPSQGLISNESPLGTAFIDKKLNDVVEVEIPSGKKSYTIISIS
ncbi:MAG: transcription elongation factor GreA [Patescibacteria group bacterium]